MGMRGKKSTSELSVVPSASVSAIQRPLPPEELTPEQAGEWRAIVNRMPADWFPRETHPLLTQYCRHAVNCRRIGGMIADFESQPSDDENWLQTYDKLLKMQDREGRALSSLATRMRISQHAQYNHKKKTGVASPAKKPWE